MLHADLIPDDRALPASNTLYGMVQVMLKGTDGRSVSKVINVRQLNREMEFHANPDNPYPAVGGDDLEFTVASEGKWRLLPNVADAYLTLKDPIEGTTGHHPSVTSFTYPFELTSNVNSYASRAATIEVNLDDLAFSPVISFDIVQSGTPPYLTITEPAAVDDPPVHEYNFGLALTPKTVEFETNADWKFTIEDNFTDLFSGVTLGDASPITPNVTQTGTSDPTGKVEKEVIFTPTASTGTMLAGKNVTRVTFTTDSHSGALPASGVLSLFRIVPPDWTLVSAHEGATPLAMDGTSSIRAAGTTVTLTASTNLPWWGQATDNTAGASGARKDSSPLSAAKTNDQITVTVPARPATNADSWNLAGTATIEAGYAGLAPYFADYSEQFSLNRPVYTISSVDVSDRTRTSVKLTVTTDAPGYNLTLTTDNATVGSLSVSNSPGSPRVVNLNDDYRAMVTRTVYVKNTYTGFVITSFEQPGYDGIMAYGANGAFGWTNRCPAPYERVDTPGITGILLLLTWNQSPRPNDILNATIPVVTEVVPNDHMSGYYVTMTNGVLTSWGASWSMTTGGLTCYELCLIKNNN
jgi:hypothetical protein